jgi:S-adenosylmethionine hydrolase
VQLPWPEARKTAAGWEGEVLYLDRFGNAITNLPAPPLPGPPSTRRGPLSSKPAFVRLPNRRRCPVAPFYQAVKAGAPLAVVGATGFLEIAVNGGNAARVFGLKVGSKVSLWLRS